MKKEIPTISAFPVGDKLPEQFSKFFIGQAYLAPLTKDSSLNCPIHNVTFEPGCRNNWHSHTGGQILVVVGGKGYYQARGEKARLLLPGDVVEIPANVEHWHGASPNSWFSHLAIEGNPQKNQNLWLEPVDDKQYAEATSQTETSACSFKQNDPELAEVFENFAFNEVKNQIKLDSRNRAMVTMGSCIAQNTLTEYKMILKSALSMGLTPIEVKEILYQAVAYVGISRIVDFLQVTNDYFSELGIKLPLAPQSTTTPENRFEKGLAAQKAIFGESIDKMQQAAPLTQKHIQRYLSDNCFGDYYTRKGLSTKDRELLTFSILISLGGCEPQVKGHIAGNVAVGNDKARLLDVITQLVPYNGYPRTLNAIRCLNEVIPEK